MPTIFRRPGNSLFTIIFLVIVVACIGIFAMAVIAPRALENLPFAIQNLGKESAAAPSGKSVVMQRRDGDMTILTNGDVQVVETWQVQFIGGPFRNAFRTFEMSHIESITDLAVSENNQSFQDSRSQSENTFSTTRTSQETKLQWYFPPTTNATRTFTLRYTLHGVVRIYPDGDQFWWQFIESDRGYPVNAMHVVQHLPTSIPADRLKLATYGGGQAARVDNRTVTFDGGPIAANSAWEIRTQFPHGIVTSPVPSWQAGSDSQQTIEFVQLAFGFLVLIGGLLGVLAWYYTKIRAKPVALPAEFLYAPPDDLPPGLAGTLLEHDADTQIMVATMVDLARRGFMKMSAQKGKYVFEHVKKRNTDALHPYEKLLFQKIFESTNRRDLQDPTDQIFLSLRKPEIQDSIYQELIDRSYFFSDPRKTNKWYLSRWAVIIGVLLCIALTNAAGLIRLAGSLLSPLAWFDIAAILVVAGAVFFVRSRTPVVTQPGAQAIAKCNAFKRYLKNIRQYTQVDQAQDQFEKYLAYAIAFGVESNWVTAFADANTPAPEWFRWDDTTRRHHDPTISDESKHAREHVRDHTVTGETTSPSLPSLNKMADNSFRGLNAMSASFFGMLNSASTAFNVPPSSNHDSSSGSSSSGWSSSDSSSSSSSDSGSSWSGGGDSGGSSGGGSSGFG